MKIFHTVAKTVIIKIEDISTENSMIEQKTHDVSRETFQCAMKNIHFESKGGLSWDILLPL